MQLKNYRTIVCLTMVLFLLLTGTAWCKAKKEEKKPAEPVPITIDADYISYHTVSGDFLATGNVVAVQGEQRITADKLDGNMNSHDVHLLGNVLFTEKEDRYTTNEAFYNYETGEGSFPEKSHGFVDNYYMETGPMVKDAEKMVFTGDNWRTKCPAHGRKCFEMKAKKVIIYPETKKLTAKKASFWLSGVKLFTVKSYTTKLGSDKKNSLFPKLGYSGKNGLEIEYNYLINDNAEKGRHIDVDLNYYSKRGFEPKLNAYNDNQRDIWTLTAGKYEDDDDYKTTVMPALGWRMKSQKIGDTPLNYNYGAEVGHYEQEALNISAWRLATDFNLFHDPIPLWENAQLNLWTGYKKNWYEHGSDSLQVFSYGAGINQKLGQKANVSLNYVHRDIQGRTPFNFDDPGKADTLYTDISYSPHYKWNFTVHSEYDLAANHHEELDYYVTTNLHCFNFTLGYREKRDEWIWAYELINF